jgi:predicted dehydrogenase
MRIGLLGAARIAPKALIVPARALGIEVAAVAARDADRARAFAAEHGVATVHASYGDLVADDTLDTVYIALPISHHAEWAIAALEAGRHVLCEKALALNAAEAQLMADAADRAGRYLVEAFHWRYHPMARRMTELAREIGSVYYAEARFDAPITPPDIRYDLLLGGGATMDLGCYSLHFLRTLLATEPDVRYAEASADVDRVDTSMTAVLRFDDTDAVMRCSMRPGVAAGRGVDATVALYGTNGWFVARNPQAPQWGASLTGEVSGTAFSESIDPADMTYRYQLKAFARIVGKQERALTGGADSVANMAAIDAVYTASGLGPRGT